MTVTHSPVESARGRAVARTLRVVSSIGLAGAVLALTGCGMSAPGPSTAADPEVRSDELADAGGRPCPKELPTGEDPSGHGFGTDEAAGELPALLDVHEAWVCRYDAFDVATTDTGEAVYGWRRDGAPEPVAAADLPRLQDALDDLTLAGRSGGCTAELGPRWMVVYSHDGDLTGVVVDDYGCGDVRLTDDPHTTPPGADDQEGAVGGVLDGGPGVLLALGVGRSS